MIFGIDEVGRGSWAGPLVVAAVAINVPVEGLRDSKRMTAKQRAAVLPDIVGNNNIVIISTIKPRQIDELGLSGAMAQACRELFSSISKHDYDTIVVDGNINYLEGERDTQAIIGADGTHAACMAASIVAKEYRDRYMRELAKVHPEYGFEKHVGYGTQAHKEALQTHGPCAAHRKSFKPVKAIELERAGR